MLQWFPFQMRLWFNLLRFCCKIAVSNLQTIQLPQDNQCFCDRTWALSDPRTPPPILITHTLPFSSTQTLPLLCRPALQHTLTQLQTRRQSLISSERGPCRRRITLVSSRWDCSAHHPLRLTSRTEEKMSTIRKNAKCVILILMNQTGTSLVFVSIFSWLNVIDSAGVFVPAAAPLHYSPVFVLRNTKSDGSYWFIWYLNDCATPVYGGGWGPLRRKKGVQFFY